MLRRVFALACVLGCLALLYPVSGQQAGKEKPAHLKILVPTEEEVVLKIDGKETKQTGEKREFISPPLDPRYTFVYTVVATWEPNNYTTVIRTRKVQVKAGEEITVDLRKPDEKFPDRFLIRFVPTPANVVEGMCKLAKVTKDDVVYDLGCGDGRIVITAVTDFRAKRGVGVDIDENLVKLSRENAQKAKVDDRVSFRKQDVLDIKDLGDASVVMLYMGEDVNARLMPILKKTLKVGSRIVSHDFKMADWEPEKTVTIVDDSGDEHIIYLWSIKKKG
jgi:uncharacterized protein (TIGR03000 family)